MQFPKTDKYNQEFLLSNMMGPNAMKMTEELTYGLNLKPGMRVLDLGYGMGLSSIFLAKEYGVKVFATDLWISSTDNYHRFKQFSLEDKIIPIHAEVHDLPYAHEYFDVVICIDAYHHFGAKKGFLGQHIVPLVKTEGFISVAIPGLKKDFTEGVPEELIPFWPEDTNFFSKNWWLNLWSESNCIKVEEAFSMECHKEAWTDWLKCDNPYAKRDIGMMKAEKDKYFDTIGIIAKRIK